MKESTEEQKLRLLVEDVELPDTAYETAKRRYEDLGRWIERAESSLKDHDPHIFVQGSFALGTAIRPARDEEYDLDLSCKLRRGISRETHSQLQLRDLVGRELEAYRQAKRVKEPLEPKRRCWRLNYQDELPFHLDVVPAIPADAGTRGQLGLLMEQRGLDRRLAGSIAADAGWITDTSRRNYSQVDLDWPSSNPDGYVRWFLSRMEGAERALLLEAQVDRVPLYRYKTPLQRAIQLLKQHRDLMFIDIPESKPASIILTTLAGQAYERGQSLEQTVRTVLQALEAFRRSNSDSVFNPVNPAEDFADRWRIREYRERRLKEYFHAWIVQAVTDVGQIEREHDHDRLLDFAAKRFGVSLNKAKIAAVLERTGPVAAPSILTGKRVSINAPARPWRP